MGLGHMDPPLLSCPRTAGLMHQVGLDVVSRSRSRRWRLRMSRIEDVKRLPLTDPLFAAMLFAVVPISSLRNDPYSR